MDDIQPGSDVDHHVIDINNNGGNLSSTPAPVAAVPPPSSSSSSSSVLTPDDVRLEVKRYGSFDDRGAGSGNAIGVTSSSSSSIPVHDLHDSKDSKEMVHESLLSSSAIPGGPSGMPSLMVNVSDDPSFPVIRPVIDKQRSLEHTARPTPHGEKAKLMEFAKLMVRMGFDEEISIEALTQTKCQSVELAVERVFRIQGDIERYERAHQMLDREEREQGITRATPRVPVSVATLADAQRSINERKEGIAKKALERDHWICERCTFINKNPAHICLVCESPREDEIIPPANPLVRIPSLVPIAPVVAPIVSDRKQPDGTIQCLICFEDIPNDDIVRAPCDHNYCSTCWRGFLVDRVNDGRVLKINCPDPECKRMLEPAEIKQRIPAELIPKYEKFLHGAELSLDENVRWCPNPGCETAMRGTKKNPKLTCPKCRFELCFNCNERWHGRTSCQEAGDAIMAAYRRENNVKLCPRCRAAIERTAGCNHMTCSRCRHEFCWMCRGVYSHNHFAPWNIFGCPGLQSGGLAFLADDSCFCCNLTICGCGMGGFIKRFFFRLAIILCIVLAFSIGLPIAILCCPCIALVIINKHS